MTEIEDGLKRSRVANGLDVLRVYSAFVVVMLHVAAQGFYQKYSPIGMWRFIYNVMGRVAVMIPRNAFRDLE